MNHRHVFVKLCLSVLLFSCSNKKTQVTKELNSIDLIKGDITLCGVQQFGEVKFSLYCSPQTKNDFELAISLLHSFEYEEAEKAFTKVLDQDPTCVMAYWGVAMSNLHPLWAPPNQKELEKGGQILAIANQLPQSKEEKQYIDAITAFYSDWEKLDHKTRILRFEEKMKTLYESNPTDTEAAIFYALALNAAADPTDKTYQRQRKAGSILETIFPDQPNHPGIAHYIIHNYDYPELAEQALSTARRYATIAPASAHAQHMPSHIFTRLGLWQECIESNLQSVSSAQCYAQSMGVDGHWDEELHGMDYLVFAYLQQGDNAHAIEQLNYLKTFKKTFPENFKIAYASAAIPTRIALENKDWAAASNLELPAFEFPWQKFPWQKAILFFGRALGNVHLKNKSNAQQNLDSLNACYQQLQKMKDDYQANQVAIQIKSIQAWYALSFGDKKKAVELMKEAVNTEAKTEKHPVTPCEVLPAVELLGDLYMEIHDYESALLTYQADLKEHPQRFNGLYGVATAAQNLNDQTLSRTYFKQLLDITNGAKSDRKEIALALKSVHSD